jgi:hypothetical protein
LSQLAEQIYLRWSVKGWFVTVIVTARVIAIATVIAGEQTEVNASGNDLLPQ